VCHLKVTDVVKFTGFNGEIGERDKYIKCKKGRKKWWRIKI
jgi:hypothetical protein